mmetsp:Transcript_27415/g.85039  ORF Transcript_27415/g.85039 Transcript_27415/m.85039 type:complete len:147 (+) Transcript_27415:783-1223(+)
MFQQTTRTMASMERRHLPPSQLVWFCHVPNSCVLSLSTCFAALLAKTVAIGRRKKKPNAHHPSLLNSTDRLRVAVLAIHQTQTHAMSGGLQQLTITSYRGTHHTSPGKAQPDRRKSTNLMVARTHAFLFPLRVATLVPEWLSGLQC